MKTISTQRLLKRLEKLRKKTVQYWNHYSEEDPGSNKELADDKKEIEDIKAELATREHYPRGKTGRALRQQAKQNR